MVGHGYRVVRSVVLDLWCERPRECVLLFGWRRGRRSLSGGGVNRLQGVGLLVAVVEGHSDGVLLPHRHFAHRATVPCPRAWNCSLRHQTISASASAASHALTCTCAVQYAVAQSAVVALVSGGLGILEPRPRGDWWGRFNTPPRPRLRSPRQVHSARPARVVVRLTACQPMRMPASLFPGAGSRDGGPPGLPGWGVSATTKHCRITASPVSICRYFPAISLVVTRHFEPILSRF